MDSNNKVQRRAVLLVIFIIVILIAIVTGAIILHGGKNLSHIESTYSDYINNLDYADGYSADHLRYALGYINDDEIPELMVCFGNAHADPVQVYSFDPKSGTVEDWGSYSCFGTFDYYERQGVVVGQDGGMGFWYHSYVQVGTPEGRSVLALEGSYLAAEDEMYYYWQSPLNGPMDMWDDFVFDSISVTKEEYEQNLHDFLASYTDKVSIGYDDMKPYTTESFHIAFRTLG